MSSNQKQDDQPSAANATSNEMAADIINNPPQIDAARENGHNRRGFWTRVGAVVGALFIPGLLRSRPAQAGWRRRTRCVTAAGHRPQLTISAARRERAFQIRVQAARDQYCQPLSVRFIPQLPPPFPGAPEPFFRPKQTNPDGTALEDYTKSDLTLEGELNKLCHNLSWGRDMSGVHWPADNYEGNYQGERLAINLLQEEAAGYPEPFEGFHLRKFDGSEVIIRAGEVVPVETGVEARELSPASESNIRRRQSMRAYGSG